MNHVNSQSAADLLVVANRLPVDLDESEGTPRWKPTSPGGLVSALEPFLRARKGAWIGWPGVPNAQVGTFDDDGLLLHPVSLSSHEVEQYYEGFANACLWPLYHDGVQRPVFHRSWWETYVAVNQRFARESASIAAEGATVWVQDYQLQLVPRILRELRPDLRIGFFLHIPFPPVELFKQLPWRSEIIRGLMGADLVGFQRPGGADNFRWLARTLLGLEPGRRSVKAWSQPQTMPVGDRIVRVGAYPISIDAAGLDQLARSQPVVTRTAEIRRDLGDPHTIFLGVDRLDYTKGIDLRLHALRELLQEGRLDPQRVSFVQLATPSRERVEHYQQMRGDIERIVSRINGQFATVGRPIVHYLHQSIPRTELAAFFSAADVMVVTPLRDGMNLVCKEYVACRYDLGGTLVLSEFAGAAAELKSAFLVNPHDLDGVKRALEAATTLNPAEGQRRMRTLRRQVLTHDVDHWARSFLAALTPEVMA